MTLTAFRLGLFDHYLSHRHPRRRRHRFRRRGRSGRMTMGMGRRPSPSSPSPSSSEKPAGLYPRTRYPEHLPDDCRDRPGGVTARAATESGWTGPGARRRMRVSLLVRAVVVCASAAYSRGCRFSLTSETEPTHLDQPEEPLEMRRPQSFCGSCMCDEARYGGRTFPSPCSNWASARTQSRVLGCLLLEDFPYVLRVTVQCG